MSLSPRKNRPIRPNVARALPSEPRESHRNPIDAGAHTRALETEVVATLLDVARRELESGSPPTPLPLVPLAGGSSPCPHPAPRRPRSPQAQAASLSGTSAAPRSANPSRSSSSRTC